MGEELLTNQDKKFIDVIKIVMKVFLICGIAQFILVILTLALNLPNKSISAEILFGCFFLYFYYNQRTFLKIVDKLMQ